MIDFPLSKFCQFAAVIFAALSAGNLHAQLTFTGLSFDTNYVAGITNDGVVIGDSVRGGYRWTRAGGETIIDPSDHGRFTWAADITADGKTVFGTRGTGPQTLIRWTEQGGIQDLGGVPGYENTTISSVSDDGSVMAVTGYDPNTSVAETYLKTAAGLQPLGHLPNSNSTWGFVSNDGKVVGGTSRGVTSAGIVQSEGFRWTQSGGMVGLGIPPGTTANNVNAISGDGSTIVGSNRSGLGASAFRWTEETGVVPLAEMEWFESSIAMDVSGDGGLIVGSMEAFRGPEPFVWTAESGMLSLTDILRFQFELDEDLFLWDLAQATAVSDNGRYIAGYGSWGSHQRRAWVVDRGENPEAFEIPYQPIPEPSTYGILGALGLFALAFRRRCKSRATKQEQASVPVFRIQHNQSTERR